MSEETNLEMAASMYVGAECTLETIRQRTGITRDKLYAYLRATNREHEIAIHRAKKTSKHIVRSPRALKALELVEAGLSEREAAERVGVSRQYINSFRRRISGIPLNQRRPPGQKIKQVPQELLNEIVADFREKKLSLQQAAERAGVTKPTIRRWLIELQVIDSQYRDKRRLKFTTEQAAEAVRMYQEGVMICEIIRITGFSRPQLYQELRRFNIKPNRRKTPFPVPSETKVV